MSLLHYQPWGVARLERTLAWLPSVDIYEEKDRFVLRADLPGVKRDDIEITAENGVLTLKGSRAIQRERNEQGRFTHAERAAGTFLRRFTLPEQVDTDAIQARYVDGVLELELPKVPEVQPRRIEVRAA